MKWAGVDYGSKMAGTTAIAWAEGEMIFLRQSRKKKDADQWIKDWVKEYEPAQLFIDAPLSLPGVYLDQDRYSDFFYRTGDKEVSAMSPMFLGGLTARAMRLSHELRESGCIALEVYPGQLSKLLDLDRGQYKKEATYIDEAVAIILQHLPGYQLQNRPENWHQVDALLAFCSGYRHQKQKARVYGTKAEGQIIA